MLITYVLMSISMMSVVFGARILNQPEMEMVYEDVDVQKKEEQVTAVMGIQQRDNATDASNGNRSSNLKYVTVLQKSSIWEEIKKKILTIKTQVDGEMVEKQPETLSDTQLKQLKQACQDGLKCVAVDQLIVLRAIKQPSNDDGKTSAVITAISKICKVITEYTTEYHEDTYQYSGVTETDDPSKVYQSVTTIIEDNLELCRIDAVSDGSSKTNGTKTNDSEPVVNTPNTANNDTYRNYDTINNYNVNTDTVNVANINIEPSDEAPKKDLSKPVTSNARKLPKNVNQENTVQVENNSPSTNQDKSNTLINKSDSQKSNTAHGTSKTESIKDSENNDQHINANKSILKESQKTVNSDVGASSDPQDSANSDNTVKNSVSIDNPGGLGKNHADTDIASSGSSNQHDVKKGSVQNGYLNNGSLKVYNQNHGVISKGEIANSNAENGTISIGTINEGPITYSTTNDQSTGKQVTEFNNFNAQQFSTTIDKIYSAMIKELPNK